jgi:hypothetical protein
MSSEAPETERPDTNATPAVAKEAPTEQQKSEPGVPRRFLPGQTVCNSKNEKGKLCNGHLKQLTTQHASEAHLRGDDMLHKCQTCGTLYTGPPQGHVRDTRKQERFVERELAAILQAAGGTLPAYDYPTGSQHAPNARRAVKPAAPAATTTAAAARPAAAPSTAPPGETPEQKKARLIAEHKAKLAAKQAGQPPTATPTAAATTPAAATPTATDKPATADETATPAPSPTAGADSSSEADRHRPAAEAQASTGQASAAPMSPAAATASPAAGAETVEDLAPEASTELTPGAPKDERKQ